MPKRDNERPSDRDKKQLFERSLPPTKLNVPMPPVKPPKQEGKTSSAPAGGASSPPKDKKDS